ncbi:MAG TPA: LacI family DNA-binding transcriptional regulator [Anaerolineaceae bacterium]|nr:LacI family DNA-binding transcriptional regulator [Anaerolineaceae bacterium]
MNLSNKRPRREDVARLAGVSVATVSYVLNNSPKPVAEETRNKILLAIQQLGYRPHGLARSLKTGNTCTIGLVIPVIASPGMAYMASIVQDELSRHGYQVIMGNAYEDPDRENNLLEILISQPVDGMIVTPASVYETSRFNQIINMGIPLVFMDRYVQGIQTDCVVTDNLTAAYNATEYLIGQGCSTILSLSYSTVASSAQERMEGYHNALSAHGMRINPDQMLVIRDPNGDSMEKVIKEHIDRYGVPDGILCTTQELGLHFVRALQTQGIPIPPKKVVIFDADWAELLSPPIPIIQQNLQSMALTAVQFLLNRLNGNTDPPKVIRIPAEMIVK